MSVSRVAIEHALDAIASDEGGMKFQGLAVVLGKLRWPELIACERKKDLGLDAHAPAILSPLHKGMGLSSSITPELEKIQADAKRAKPHFSDLQILVFVTSGKVTNYTVEQWQAEIKKEYGWDLIVMSREEIIATLQMPNNVGLCAEHLGIAVPPPEPTVESLIRRTLAANGEIIVNWSRRLGDTPVIDLRLVRLDDKGAETQEMQQRAGLHELLSRSHRVVFEAPAGRGKTTTLVQLAREQHAQGKIAFLIDLPAWVRRNVGVFEFIAGTPEFQARGLTASDLARVQQAGHIVFLLNGWNELAVSESATAAGMIRDLERSFAGAGIAVATRAHPIAPPLPGSSRFRIQPLTRQERGDYLRTRLGDGAQPLIEQLRADRVLDDLTRTPMILAEVVSLFQAGKKIPTSRLGVLDAVTQMMENSVTHQAALANLPLSGLGRAFLERLGSSLVTRGGVQLPETTARQEISACSRALQDVGQLGALPDPGSVLTALCSHHVLERSSYPDVIYTFLHQQFQESFAALHLKRELSEIVTTGTGREDFAARYVNEPAWTQPIEMLAEFIGRHSDEEPLPDAVAMGQALVEMALPLDAPFAAKLARLCGTEVWRVTRDALDARLRQLWQSSVSQHRDIAVAGMVASGSEDFKDILEPLLSSEDTNLQLEPYRTGEPFEVTSLGAAWEDTVSRWPEGARASFVAEMMQRSPAPAEVIAFAMKDPSPGVRKNLFSFVWWGMSLEEISRFSQTLDDADFKELIAGMHASELPPSMHPRALESYVAAGSDATGPLGRFLAWRQAASFGHEGLVDELKESLSQLEPDQVRDLESRDLQGRELRATIEMLRRTDSPWVTTWVVQNLLAGALRPDGWIDLVDGLTETQRSEFLNRVTSDDLSEMRVPGIIPLLRKFADREIVERLFRRICELIPIIATSTPGDNKQAEAKLARQLEDLLRGMPPNPVVDGILQEIGGSTDVVQIVVVTEIFHLAGRDDASLREGLSAEVRGALRNYLNSAMPTVLAQDDFSGQLKGYFATVLAQVGEASDLAAIERLIEADIERVRTGRLARAADHHSKQGNGAVMSWTGWYVQAMIHLAADSARDLLIYLLTVSDYEHDAAWGLFQLARSEPPSPLFRARAWPMRSKDFSLIWNARAGEREPIFREPQRTELAAVLRHHIETLIAERATESQPAAPNGRLKQLAIVLAELDGQASAELVLEILSYPQIEPSRPRTHHGTTRPIYLYDAWPRIHGLEALLMQGVVLPSEKTWEIVEPIIEHVRSHRWNSQESSLISHVVGIVLFTDDPSASIQRVRQLIEEKLLSMEGARELAKALGHSRCPDAVALLQELASDTVRVQYMGNDWVDAAAQFDSHQARNLLLSFIDPALPPLSNELIRRNDGRLVRRLTELAQRDTAVRQRMFDLAQENIPVTHAVILGKVLVNLGTTDALLASLQLIRDGGAGGASYELHKNIEETFVEHRPYPGSSNAVTMVPRSSNAIRSRLMEMVQNDPLRRRSAFALLNEIERWRMWHGRPDGEPRSPKIEVGFLWPPELEDGE
jgi:hypothetical protein